MKMNSKYTALSFVLLGMLLYWVFLIDTGVAEAESQVTSISQEELLAKLSAKEVSGEYIVIDVRSPEEFQEGRVKSAVNIPHDKILHDISLLDQYIGKEMIFYCHSGVRVKKVTDLLTDLQYQNLFHLTGDMSAWQSNNQPIEK